MKNGINQPLRLGALLAIGVFIHSQAEASLTFYAPYDTNYNLTVGLNPGPIATNGSPGITTGFQFGHPGGGALDAPSTTNGVTYKRLDSYFTGVGNNVAIGSNSFRFLYQPDFSGVQASRVNIFNAGPLGTSDSLALFNSDGMNGPTFMVTIASTQFRPTGLSNFNWNSSTWYYMAGSFDRNGLNFYIQAMTNNSVASFQSVSFGTSNSWGGGGFLDAQNVKIGIRNDFGTASEGARGNIDEVKMFSNEKWSFSDFGLDYAVIIPEPSSGLLIVAAGALAFFRKRNG